MPDRLYLDHAATTPLLPEALAAMEEGVRHWANPSSPHAEGRRARAMLEEARARIAAALGWDGAVILTGGATEAIALAASRARCASRWRSAVEHDAVRRAMPDAGVLPVDGQGRVEPAPLVGPAPLVAIQHANGETGVVQDAAAISMAVRAAGGLWLADCAQSAAKRALPDADFIVISGHKLGAPPGVGALLVRDLAMLAPTGGQEQGYRGGTENLPAVLALAAALEAPRDWLNNAIALRATLDDAVRAAGGAVVADGAERLPTVAGYRMPGVRSAAQLVRFDLMGIAVSAGSACASGALGPSPVLRAMGLDDAVADEVVRVSFGRGTTAADVDRFIGAWRQVAGT